MKRKGMLFALAALLVTGLVARDKLQTKADSIAKKQLIDIIEEYKYIYGCLPENLDDINVESVKAKVLSYKKINESEYEVSFITPGYKSPIILSYNSGIGEWKSEVMWPYIA